MSRKEVYLFDNANKPLQVKGIRVELFDASSFKLLDAQNSDDLNPTWGGPPSNEWGVVLSFSAPHGNPLDIYITDPTHSYPGNIARNLYGGASDRINLDLLKLPKVGGGQQGSLNSATPRSISDWVDAGSRWQPEEKDAVRNLLFNYIAVIGSRIELLPHRSGLREVANNWQESLLRLKINPEVLSGLSASY
jgi:hypothetical protein